MTTSNGTTYNTTKVTIGKSIYNVMVATGKSNYINVTRTTNNPFRGMGKDFADFNAAVAHYKNPTMKVELLKIEMGL